MADLRERFYSEVKAALAQDVESELLEKILMKVAVVADSYELTLKSTELVVYESMPPCAKNYLVTRKIEGLADGSLALYKLRLEQFFKTMRKPIEQISTADIRLFLYYYQQESQCSDRTLDTLRTILSGFFKWIVAEGYIQSDPTALIKPIRYIEKPRGFLSEVEMEQLREGCTNVRNKAIIETLYSTGCRVSELVGIKVSDIDFATSTVTLLGKGSKYRKSYLNARAELSLKDWLKTRDHESEFVFTSFRAPHAPIKTSEVRKIVCEAGEASGIGRKVFPHLIRHTTATLALQRGMPVVEIQRMLGHVNADTTLIYAQLVDDTVKASHKKCVV